MLLSERARPEVRAGCQRLWVPDDSRVATFCRSKTLVDPAWTELESRLSNSFKREGRDFVSRSKAISEAVPAGHP